MGNGEWGIEKNKNFSQLPLILFPTLCTSVPRQSLQRREPPQRAGFSAVK